MKSPLEVLQPLGRALMLPIAVLPVAALLLRIGQADLLGAPALGVLTGGFSLAVAGVFAAAGGAIFSNLGLIFAVGVAVGLARENHGAAGLAGVVAYLVATKGADALITPPPEVLAAAVAGAKDLTIAAWKAREIGKLSIPVGILAGLIAGGLYNRYSTIKFPEYLAFFGGRRFVPIAAGLAGVLLALVFGFGWGVLEGGVDALSALIIGSGNLGLFVYGILNRILIVTGLHHILNNVVWFILGDFNGVTGDLNRFAAGDPSAGAFMSGFFPVMMFGLPAACLAMLHTARPDRRKAVSGMLTSLAMTSFLTGVTEPIEFSFMFLAPLLYAVHAVLTGLSMVIMNLLDIKLGFGFSAGLFDYVLNFNKATRPLLLLPIGLVYGAVYYFTFRYFIVRFDLKTPGREVDEVSPGLAVSPTGSRAQDFVIAMGGAENLVSVDACTTRLRVVLADQGPVDEARLRSLGARGVVRPSERALQVVLGPIADQVASEIRAVINAGPSASLSSGSASVEVSVTVLGEHEMRAQALIRAVGGADNIEAHSVCSSRLRVLLKDEALLDPAVLESVSPRGFARVGDGVLHVLLGPDAPAVGLALSRDARSAQALG